jgi:hydrogenase nickel incorporation protein HypA/HybF
MHELSIAGAIVAIAEEHAAGRRVTQVDVKVGHLRQVAPGALRLAFELVAAGTPVQGAELVIEQVPAAIACRKCGAESRLNEFPFACPGCGGIDIDVLSGDELLVDSLELADETVPAGRAAVLNTEKM